MLIDLSQAVRDIWTQVLSILAEWGGENLEICLCDCRPRHLDSMIANLRAHLLQDRQWDEHYIKAMEAFKSHEDMLVVELNLGHVPANCLLSWTNDAKYVRVEISMWPGDLLGVVTPPPMGGIDRDVALDMAQLRFESALSVIRQFNTIAGASRVEAGLAGDVS